MTVDGASDIFLYEDKAKDQRHVAKVSMAVTPKVGL